MSFQLGVNHPTDANAVVGGASSTSRNPTSIRVPFTMPEAQVYYWRARWQVGEREALGALAAGDFTDFAGDDPEDVRRWLNEPDSPE